MVNFYVRFLTESVLLGPSEMESRVARVQELLNKQIHGKPPWVQCFRFHSFVLNISWAL